MIKDKLDIVLITYNRKDYTKRTLEQILSTNSPIRDFDITILNNASTDGTTELLDEYSLKYKNLKHVINNKNIGGCANIAKALVETPKKEYVWVICDNDTYDWNAWSEIENGIKNSYDVIFTRNCKNNIAQIFYESAFLPACIYKTSVITESIAENIYCNIKMLFPHLPLIAKNINDNNSVFIPSKNIVEIGKNPNQNESFTRGHNKRDLPDGRKNIFWSVGFFSSLEYINDIEKRIEIIEGVRHYNKTLFDLFKTIIIKNKLFYNNYKPNLYKIFFSLDMKNKFKFLFAFLSVKFSFKDYSFYEMREKEEWIEYFKKVKEEKYLKKLSKKLKNKKVLIYGAGIVSKVLFENYNFKDFDIVGISDLRFEKSDEKQFYSHKTIKPTDVYQEKFDVIIFTMLSYDKALKSLRTNGIVQKVYPIIKMNSYYPIKK